MRCASPMSASSVWGGQVRPTARSFARYASSAGLAVAIAALLTRAAPAIMGTASLAGQRGEGNSIPFLSFGVSKAASSVRVQSGTNMKNSESSQRRLLVIQSALAMCGARAAPGCPETPFPGKDGVMSGGSSSERLNRGLAFLIFRAARSQNGNPLNLLTPQH